jgi:exosome complex RNA-binding protein Csl4
MKEFCDAAGLKVYPGSESAAGETFRHGDGVTKSVLMFTTADPLDKIASFYKAEGLDIKVPSKPIGMTKSGAQVMISVTSGKDGKNVIELKGLVSSKKSP